MRHTQRLLLGGNQRQFIPEKTEIDGSSLLGVQQPAVGRRPDASAAGRGTESTARLPIGTNRNAGMQHVRIFDRSKEKQKLHEIYSVDEYGWRALNNWQETVTAVALRRHRSGTQIPSAP